MIQVLKVTDTTTSEYLSNLLGNTTLDRFSAELWHVRQQKPEHKAMSDQVHPRPVLLPQEIRTLHPTKVLTHCPGFNTFLLDRQPYYAPHSPWRACIGRRSGSPARLSSSLRPLRRPRLR